MNSDYWSIVSDDDVPADLYASAGKQGFGIYVHIPFCARRCGYCDFATYALEGGVSSQGYVDAVLAEIARAARLFEAATLPLVTTVFFGGGTPTLLPCSDLGLILEHINMTWGLASGAEITVEANPESVNPSSLRCLRSVGFTRISLGMQSASARVLRILDRRHSPLRAIHAVHESHDAGFKNINIDLMYGVPGESREDLSYSLREVIQSGVDHVSAYALTVEPGTRLAARIDRGELPSPDDDVAADDYVFIDRELSTAGFHWYEISNWAREDSAQCRHNNIYWNSADWWGLGSGAHSHIGGVRWWNVRHPDDYRRRLAEGLSPTVEREVLTPQEQYIEKIFLEMRLKSGLSAHVLTSSGRHEATMAIRDGLIDADEWKRGRAVLTRHGRFLADSVIRRLMP